MNKEQREKVKKSYIAYIFIGILYVLVKIVFVLAGYLHPGAILHGLVPAVITATIGIIARMDLKKSASALWHRLMAFAPLLVFIITPIYMFLKEGDEWLLNGRLEVLIIYELMSLIQFLIGLKRLKAISS